MKGQRHGNGLVIFSCHNDDGRDKHLLARVCSTNYPREEADFSIETQSKHGPLLSERLHKSDQNILLPQRAIVSLNSVKNNIVEFKTK